MSDLHIDYDYTPGYSKYCTQPVCCRHRSGLAKRPEDAAGRWGDYQCDLNQEMLFSMFDEIKSHNPDAIFWVGDSIPHNVPTLDFNANVNIMKNITR
jgi:hypothetical protein